MPKNLGRRRKAGRLLGWDQQRTRNDSPVRERVSECLSVVYCPMGKCMVQAMGEHLKPPKPWI